MHAAALRYVDAVARYGSIRRAAAELNISASAINRQILQLEDLLGVELFERRASGLKPTEFGEMVIEHARRTLHDFEALKSEIGYGRNWLTGLVRIATLDSLTINVLPRAMIAFRELHPAVRFRIETHDPTGVARLVSNDSADIGLTFGSETHAGITVRHQVPASLCAVMHSRHPLAQRKRLSVFECQSDDMILQEDSGPVGGFLGSEIEAVKRASKPILTSDTIVASKAYILSGGGVGFFTRFGFIEEIEAGDVVAIPLVEERPSSLTLATIVSSARRKSRTVDGFIDQLSSILDAEVAGGAIKP